MDLKNNERANNMADNLNISPEMIKNLVNMLNNSNNQTSNNKNGGSNPSSNISEETKKTEFSFNINSENEDRTHNANSSNNGINFGNLDIETIMKIKSIMESLNTSNDQDSKLLYSLKPYLRKSKQAKLDQYINILKISQVSKLFKKGDVN